MEHYYRRVYTTTRGKISSHLRARMKNPIDRRIFPERGKVWIKWKEAWKLFANGNIMDLHESTEDYFRKTIVPKRLILSVGTVVYTH